MTQQLKDMAIDKVSLVDRGANGRTFALLKRAEEAPPATPDQLAALWKASDAADPVVSRKGLLAKLADLLGVSGPVAKARTFAAVIAGQQLQDALYDSWYTLEDSLWSAIYAHDQNGTDLTIEAKQALVAQNLDEFKAWLLAQMTDATAIAKADPGAREARGLAAFLRKVAGADIGRVDQLTKAAEPLIAALGDVGSPDPDVIKRALPEEDDMSVDVQELAKALQPMIETAVDAAVEKRMTAQPAPATPPAAPVAKADTEDDDVPEPVAKAIVAIADRLEKLEGAPGQRTSLDGQAETPVRKRSSWTAGLADA